MKPGADITDFFNYGFTEKSWIKYCEMQKKTRDFVSSQRQVVDQQDRSRNVVYNDKYRERNNGRFEDKYEREDRKRVRYEERDIEFRNDYDRDNLQNDRGYNNSNTDKYDIKNQDGQDNKYYDDKSERETRENKYYNNKNERDRKYDDRRRRY